MICVGDGLGRRLLPEQAQRRLNAPAPEGQGRLSAPDQIQSARQKRLGQEDDAFEMNVATHNYSGPIGTLITAAYCGVGPNFRIMEIDNMQVPWAYDFLTEKPVIENGYIALMSCPGWGADVNEDAVKEHSPIQEKSGLV